MGNVAREAALQAEMLEAIKREAECDPLLTPSSGPALPCCYSHRVVITKVARNVIAVPAILDGTGRQTRTRGGSDTAPTSETIQIEPNSRIDLLALRLQGLPRDGRTRRLQGGRNVIGPHHGRGWGRIVPNFAVLGGRNPRYESVNGLRSEIPGLAEWAGLTSVEYASTTDDDGTAPAS